MLWAQGLPSRQIRPVCPVIGEAADVVFSILCVPPGSDFSCFIITVQERKCKRKFMVLKCENVENRKSKKGVKIGIDQGCEGSLIAEYVKI